MKLTQYILTGKQSDVKFIRKTQEDPAGLQGLCREAQNMKTSSHPSIVKSLKVINRKKSLVLLSKYVSRDKLCDDFTHHGQVTEEVPDKFCQLLSVVEYCHQQGMIGGDQKLETLLFDKKLKQREHTPSANAWSLGVVWYCLATGFEPFEGEVFWEAERNMENREHSAWIFMSLGSENLWYTLTTIQPKISTPTTVRCWSSIATCSSTGLSSEQSSLTSEGTSIGTTISGPRCNSPATNSDTSSEHRQPGRMSLEPKNRVLKTLGKFKKLFKKHNKIEPQKTANK
ncbi:MAP/microtubule affinity-regulating kinase 3-like [Felis catus]|uniref:MAP/microtubule affinity-regulating kinase 3-like n=1 Tax=Felis catus TaxID=9685 RepID=UPI001D19D667|nr:MAP/microtubule affinity-regulating kinase 3-like [Felis catus]XP_044907956.1 MAP/microtubule affinity-regulating kinase 3-like [Felis catus]XP_044909141.1 MAP/microtubule affinity-regulating kinase 3-like [Felis catus]XP_044909142.1 MAP/microtubule affinity-regulating kinase 3-like [Felis catus]XP_044909144.1 MAP/microtubule affinity-regulating kinase 3-like [Felis catus]